MTLFRWRGLLGIGLVAAVLASGVSACGDDSDDATTTTTAPSVSAYQPELQRFAQCVSEQGVDPPPPTQWMAPGGVTPELLQAAAECREYLPPYGQRILDQALRER